MRTSLRFRVYPVVFAWCLIWSSQGLAQLETDGNAAKSAATPAAQEDSQARNASRAYPPRIEDASVEVYKVVGDVQLNIYIFQPPRQEQIQADPRPAIVFFFGGGWKSGSPTQFEQHGRHLAERGMVAAIADYRVSSRHGVKAVDCVADAKSAVRWIRKNSSRLGIAPNLIAAGGGSAGGHLAACTALLKEFDESEEDLAVSSVPNALALFNPAVVLAPVPGEIDLPGKKLEELTDRMGVAPVKLSPFHQIAGSAPPTIIFHGEADQTVSYRSAEVFTQAMQNAGNRCELLGYPGQGHGFFNYGRNDGEYYQRTLASLDEFLVSLGYLQPLPADSKPNAVPPTP